MANVECKIKGRDGFAKRKRCGIERSETKRDLRVQGKERNKKGMGAWSGKAEGKRKGNGSAMVW